MPHQVHVLACSCTKWWLPASQEAQSSNHGSCDRNMAAYPDPDDVVAPTAEEEAGRAVQSQHAASVAPQHPAKHHHHDVSLTTYT